MAVLYLETFDHYADIGEIVTIGGFSSNSNLLLDTSDDSPKPTSGVGQGPNIVRANGSGSTRSFSGPPLPGSVDQGTFAYWFRSSGTVNNQFSSLLFTSDASIALVFVGSTTEFRIDGATIADVTSVLGKNTGWHWVCIEFDTTGAEWSVDLYVDGNLIVSHTTTTTPGADSADRFFSQYGQGGGILSWKNMVLADGATDLRAPRFAQPILPDEDVSNTGVTSTAATDYGAVNNNSDASYLEFDTAGDKVELGFPSRSDIDPAFNPGIVDALAVYSRGLSDGSTPDELTVTVKDGGTPMQPGESTGALPLGGSTTAQIVQGADVSTLDDIHIEVEAS